MADQFAPDRWWWEYHPDTKERIALTSKAGDVLLATGDDQHSWLIVAEDKARLIEAAPALLANLRLALWHLENPDVPIAEGALDNIRAAIARATQPDA